MSIGTDQDAEPSELRRGSIGIWKCRIGYAIGALCAESSKKYRVVDAHVDVYYDLVPI
jgi:hypothetical protein